MSTKKKHIAVKIILGLFLVILIAGGGFALWFTSHYKTIIRAKLPGLMARATDSLYNISIQDVSINIFTRKVTISGVNIWADTNRVAALYKTGKAPLAYFVISAPAVEVSGIKWAALAADRELDLGWVTVKRPEVTITVPPVDSLHPQVPPVKKRSALELITIKNVEIADPMAMYRVCKQKDTSFYRVHGGRIMMTDWRLDPQQPNDDAHFLHAERTQVALDSFSFRKPGSLYDINMLHVIFSTDSSRLALKGLEVKTNVSHQVFYRSVGHQKDIFHILFKDILFESFDWKRLMHDQVFAAQNATLNDALIDIFFSRLPPPNTESKMGNFPNQLLAKLKLKVDISKLNIRNGHFKYTEINEETKLPGVLLFDDISGHISNVTNVETAVAANNSCIVKLQGKFMKKSPMNATFHFVLNDKDGAFSVDGGMTGLEAAQINDASEALAKAEIKSMHVDKLDLHVAGNQYGVKSDIQVLYRDLQIDLKKVDGPKQLSRTPVLSFLANKVLLYTDNPMRGEDARITHPQIKRDPYKSFFKQIWKCIFTGAEETAVKSERLEKALEAKQAEKGKPEKEKKSLLQHIFEKHK